MKLSRASPEPRTTTSSASKLRKHATFDTSGYYHAQQNAQRKRAKRQTAGALVTGLLGQQAPVKLTPSGKKSTAQPRPAVTVQPRGIGPVMDPNDNDVLCGRGGRINAHVGNVRFREMVVSRKKEYLSPATKKLEKAHIAAQLVQDIRAKDPPGRFLKEDPDGSWYDIGDAKAIKKVGQALREDASEVRNDGHSDEDATTSKPSAKKSVAIPQQAVKQQQQHDQYYPSNATTSNNSQGASDSASSTFEPLAFQPATQPSHPRMGPPLALGGAAAFPTNQYGNNRNVISGAAAALMDQEDNPLDPQLDVAFGRAFHIADTRVPSELSGLTNSVVTGMSGLTDEAARSTLSGRRAQPHRGHHFHAAPPRQLQQLRQAFEATGSNRTMQGSDVINRAVMPASVPPPPRPFRRSLSWQDNSSYVDGMSWAENSLVGGGIHDSGSILSGRSMYSQQMRTDADSLYEHLTQGSLASRRSNQAPYSQGLYTNSRSSPPQASGGASVASMSLASLASGGVASVGSVKTIMSDLSANLVALDLAEPHLRDDYNNTLDV